MIAIAGCVHDHIPVNRFYLKMDKGIIQPLNFNASADLGSCLI
jgi:hypothetical protein